MLKIKKNTNPTDPNSIQQAIKNINKDTQIEKLLKEISTLSKEIIKLRSENADLRSRVSLIYSLEQNYKCAKETINEIRDQTNKIIYDKDEEHRKLKKKIEQMELEKTLENLSHNRDMTLYNQKMSVVHHIEHENRVYKDEVNDLKKKNEELGKATKEKLESLDILNQIKFSQFKKKMIDNLKDAKDNVSRLNLEYMDLNGKITILQNHQLLSEIEFQKEQIDNLDKENLKLKKKIFDLEREIAIHKEVEIKLAIKAKNSINNSEINSFMKNNKKKPELNFKNSDILPNNINQDNRITLLPINNNNLKSIKSNNNNYNTINKEKINDILSNNIANEYTNKNNQTVSKSSTEYNKKFRLASGNKNYNTYYDSERDLNDIDFKYIKYNKILKKKNDEIEKLNITIDNLKNKLDKYIGKNKSLFSFLDECLNIYFNECHEELKNKNINLDIENIKKFNFESLNKEEKYSVLVILMNYLMPLVAIGYNTNSFRDNFFKTNLNINLVNRSLSVNSAEKYLKDSCLKKAFQGKKIKNNLFGDTYSTQNFGNGNIIRVLRKLDSPTDLRLKDNTKTKSNKAKTKRNNNFKERLIKNVELIFNDEDNDY